MHFKTITLIDKVLFLQVRTNQLQMTVKILFIKF